MLREDVEERYERIVQDLQNVHQREIIKYQDKVTYLMLKVEALEAEKTYLKNSTIGNESSLNLPFGESFNHDLRQHQQSMNLKMSKASLAESLTNYTPKS